MRIILEAILVRTAFGVVAKAMVYIAFMELLIEQGLTAAASLLTKAA